MCPRITSPVKLLQLKEFLLWAVASWDERRQHLVNKWTAVLQICASSLDLGLNRLIIFVNYSIACMTLWGKNSPIRGERIPPLITTCDRAVPVTPATCRVVSMLSAYTPSFASWGNSSMNEWVLKGGRDKCDSRILTWSSIRPLGAPLLP